VYPVVLRLEGRRCLVVGGGGVARRKVEGLLASGAVVTVVAPVVDDGLRAVADGATGRLTIEERPYREQDLAGAWLAIAATDDAAVQQRVFDDGERTGVWVNAADDPDRCALFLPAVHRREPVIVAVSTEGTSPALAGWLRDRLAAALPPHLDELVAAVAAERDAVRASGRSTEGLDWQARIDALAAAVDDQPPRDTGGQR
jgi:precorrin-2 dehydrogenase/sirohydrochlorin ferrochelatase